MRPLRSLVLSAVLAFAAAARADSPEPISQAYLANEKAAVASGPGVLKAFFDLLLWGYRNGVSPADGPTCSFTPTCAGFALEALRKHGVAEGILMTGDRLLRCNPYDRSIYPRIGPDGHYLDPVR
ncbi:MAG: membrane protein insertion efficiency factor YidD [Fibrobacteres bacterium]|nr:membrane protein insertion efficiency factor YidD [Fibrobacterota bacterium]